MNEESKYLFLPKPQRHTINTIPLSGWLGPIIKQMAEMPAAILAADFYPLQAMTDIFQKLYFIFIRVIKTRPAAAGIKFSV